jgi:5-formyltetrahydrofolate cyclo-ligase
MDKISLRREIRAQRRALSAPAARAAAARLLRLALRHRLLRFRRVGFYLPMEEEIDLIPLLNTALWLRRACYLPVIPQRGARRLWFSRINGHDAWYQNRFGIFEHGAAERVRARQLDVLFVPLVAFDAQGNRLGMGGGYYDTTLAYLRARRMFRKPKLIGVAYDFQHVADLPCEPWDVPLDAVLTDRALYQFKKTV